MFWTNDQIVALIRKYGIMIALSLVVGGFSVSYTKNLILDMIAISKADCTIEDLAYGKTFYDKDKKETWNVSEVNFWHSINKANIQLIK